MSTELEPQAPVPAPSEPRGFNISRGVALQLVGLRIEVDDNGELNLKIPALNLRLDTSVHWLEIAMDHLAAAKAADAALVTAHSEGKGLGDLQPTFKASMQAIVASATFFEAIYAAARDRMPAGRQAPLSADGSGARRSRQVTEQLKRAFGLKPEKVTQLAGLLTDLYRLRDEAVHPSSSFSPSVVHPQFGVLVERRFATYTYPHALFSVRVACAYCKVLAIIGKKDGPKEVHELAQCMLDAGEPLFQAWEESYGPLLDG
ncbi:hypothetical protein [Roseateles sp. P5_E8]